MKGKEGWPIRAGPVDTSHKWQVPHGRRIIPGADSRCWFQRERGLSLKQ